MIKAIIAWTALAAAWFGFGFYMMSAVLMA